MHMLHFKLYDDRFVSSGVNTLHRHIFLFKILHTITHLPTYVHNYIHTRMHIYVCVYICAYVCIRFVLLYFLGTKQFPL